MKVKIIATGASPIRPKRLSRLLNVRGSPYEFDVAWTPNDMGDADLAGFGYSDDAFERFADGRISNQHEICVVITDVPIEGNHFARTVGDRLVITTFHQATEILHESGRSSEDYAAMTICAELLSIEFQRASGLDWSALFHEAPDGCLFDYTGVKTQMVGKLRSCKVCDRCQGILTRSGANVNVVSFARALLSRIRTPSIAQALMMCVSTPGLSFAYGGVVIGGFVNVASSIATNPGTSDGAACRIAIALLIALIAVPLAVYARLLCREARLNR